MELIVFLAAFGAVYMLQDDDDFEDVMSILGIF